ncbi:MAG: uncharacterized protein JWM76_4475 [Pseudonocardiales bacterium]|nr:uncharacterized protein [Pseudonocardiales bacterium]
MTNPTDIDAMIGRTALDSDGAKIGKVSQVYLDDQTQQPVWIAVHTGLFGNKESFAPLFGAHVTGDEIVLGVSKDLVKDAPSVDADGHLEDDENDRLYAHYAGYFGTDSQARSTDAVAETAGANYADADVAVTRGSEGHDLSGPNTDDAMTRSEERLHVDTEQVEAGRARLRKYVVTENVTTSVPVSHEEVRLEREPITDANRDAAMSGGAITSEEHEVVLHAEQPVVSKETVPVERVRIGTETVTEQQSVTEEVRKEQIDEQPEIIEENAAR